LVSYKAKSNDLPYKYKVTLNYTLTDDEGLSQRCTSEVQSPEG